MAYSDFTLKKVKTDFDIKTVENLSIFSAIEEVEISQNLIKTLQKNVPLALAINTEKARSELIIINILLELKEKLSEQISLFSGIDFNVDKEKGLNGFCDYIISGSCEQLYLEVPIITIIEAKNENINSGMGQCIAEMYAAKIFNDRENRHLPCIYGAITTGDEWKFIKLKENIAYIDLQSYYINDIKKVVGILMKMAEQKV
ncbi:conserved hypothetical protein [Beggiatoa sp. PS]|nr:conserved hypothetical protein [Beggiatoa sp. PS]